MGTSEQDLAQRDPRAKVLAETLAEVLDATRGVCRVELDFQDGELQHIWRHERVGATALGRYDLPK